MHNIFTKYANWYVLALAKQTTFIIVYRLDKYLPHFIACYKILHMYWYVNIVEYIYFGVCVIAIYRELRADDDVERINEYIFKVNSH